MVQECRDESPNLCISLYPSGIEYAEIGFGILFSVSLNLFTVLVKDSSQKCISQLYTITVCSHEGIEVSCAIAHCGLCHDREG